MASSARTGDGYTNRPEGKPSLRDIIFRRSAAANAGLASDVQPANTARFQVENGVKPPRKRS